MKPKQIQTPDNRSSRICGAMKLNAFKSWLQPVMGSTKPKPSKEIQAKMYMQESHVFLVVTKVR
jgi:hypothetical protein